MLIALNPKSPCVKFLEKYQGQYYDNVVKELIRINKYEKYPIENMECYCCHAHCLNRQWVYREEKMGICEKCAPKMQQHTTALEMIAFYGIEGIHYNIEIQ